MRITTLGKIAILLVLVGCFVGVYRFLVPSSNTASNQNQTGTTTQSGVPTNPSNGQPSGIQVSIQTSGTYQSYVEKLAQQLAKESTSVSIKPLPPKESRDALHSILEQTKGSQSDIPDVWLASSDALVQNLRSATKSGMPSLANVNDTRTYAIWPPQPMVLLCKTSAKDRLATIFSGPNPLGNLNGAFKFSFPDPITSGGGHTALGYCAWAFKQQSRFKDFGSYLGNLKTNGYQPLAAPSGGLASEFGSSQLDFIFVHNALADREVDKSGGSLSKVVPAVTVWERPSSIALRPSSGWTAEKEKALQDVIEFLRRNPPYNGSGANDEAQIPEQMDIQKQTWERVFDGGARAKNINQPANLPMHPR
ncbi:MAG: hypothetical protein WCI55_03615 [Armatimonadota bacterium]